MKGVWIKYTQEELDFIKCHSTMLRRELAALFNARFGRQVSEKNIHGLCKRKGWMTGRTGTFYKGQPRIPNSGAKGPNKTSFKKGNRPQTWQPVGTERITREGYLERKIADTRVKKNDWVLVHRMTWEQHHGRKVPPNHIVIFVDGDKANFDPDNLQLISRGENVVINKHRLRDVAGGAKPAAITLGRVIAKTRQIERSQ